MDPARSQERGRMHRNPRGGVGPPGRTWSPTVAEEPCPLCDSKALIAKPVVSLPNSTASGVALQDLGRPRRTSGGQVSARQGRVLGTLRPRVARDLWSRMECHHP